MQRLILILILILTFAALGNLGCSNLGQGGQATPTPPPANNVPQEVAAEARVVPFKQARLAFPAPGRVTEVLVEEGDTVTVGQTLARIDSTQMRNALAQAEAAVKVAQAQLEKTRVGAREEDITVAETAVKVAQAQLERAGIGPRAEEIGAAQSAVNVARAELNRVRTGATEQDIEVSRLAVEEAKNRLWGIQAQRDAVCGRVNDRSQPSQADCDQARANVQAAEQGVQIAEQAYAKIQAGPRVEDVGAAQARVDQAQAQLRVAQVGARPADIAVAQAQFEQAQAQLQAAKAAVRPVDIQVAQAQLDQAQAALNTAKAALNDTELKAPFAGTVAQLYIKPGEIASPQTPALLLGDISKLRLETDDLAEADVTRVQVGQTAKVTFDALPNQTFTAKVARISPVSAEKRGDTVYTVWLDFDGAAPQGARWGMKALVDIQVK